MIGWGKAWALRAVGIMVGAVLLASCGGGEQIDRFVPRRIVSFGDESSVIEADATKYTINFLAEPTTEVPNPTIDCNQLQIWNQIVANAYSLPFPQCPVSGIASSPSVIRAQADAKVQGAGSVTAQIDAFLATDAFAANDLVTIMAGTNDVLELNAAVEAGSITLDQAAGEAQARGTALAGQVNRVAQLGGKVLIATIPDVGNTPFGRVNANRIAALNRLSDRFNSRLRVGLINDGRMIGLVLLDENLQLTINLGTLNSATAACNDATLANVRTCTSRTLRTVNGVAATATTYLWADNIHMSPAGHSSAGSLAFQRASNNPF